MRKFFVLAIAAVMTLPAFATDTTKSATVNITGTVANYATVTAGASVPLTGLVPDAPYSGNASFTVSTNCATALSAVGVASSDTQWAAPVIGVLSPTGPLAAGAGQTVTVPFSGTVPWLSQNAAGLGVTLTISYAP